MRSNDHQLSEHQQITLWFVRVRWAVILMMLAVILFSVFIGRLHFALFPSLAVLSVGISYNLLYPFLVRRFPAFSEPNFTYMRSSTDVLIITLLIHFTGGVESPFKLLYMLELGAIAFFSYTHIAYLMCGQAALLYFVTCGLETYGFIRHYQLIATPGAFYLSPHFLLSKSISLFLALLMTVFLASYLASRLKEKQKEIEKLLASKLEFTNMVVHEIKSPLTSVIGYADVLSDQTLGPVAESQKEPLAIIKRQSKRMLAMANDLLDLARFEAGKTKLDKKTVSLNEIAEHAVEEMKPQLDQKKIDLIQELPSSTPQLALDDSKILQVLINLFSNAIKFSYESGKIYISLQAVEKSLQFSIRDEGLGIEPFDLPHIFEKFYRASKESAQVKGTGLGLALSKVIIEAHGGKIWASSSGHNKGAVFYFTLPL